MDYLGLGSSILSTAGQAVTDAVGYGQKVKQKKDQYDVLQQGILNQSSAATNFNQLAQDFNNLQWSNFNPTLEDFVGSDLENGLNITAKTLSSAINGVKSTGSPWGALMGIPTLAANLGGYFSSKQDAKSNIQSIKEENTRINNILTDRYNYRASAISQNNTNNALLNIKAFGGNLHMNDIFNNGVKFIEEGGSHEENPLGGVPQGIAPDGQPNLVEEGEVIFNDYVYSKRLKVPKKDYEMLGLKENKEYTYADAAEIIQKESEERPNDPLSKKNKETMFARLQGSQDELKQKRDTQKMKKELSKMSPEEQAYMLQAMQQPQIAAYGGHLFSGKEKGSNKLYKLNTDGWSYTKPESGPYVMNNGQYYALPSDFNAQEAWDNLTYDNEGGYWKVVTPTESSKGFSGAQALRAMPVIGSAIGALSSVFDKPDYSNIERAEAATNAVPKVAVQPIGQKLTYKPIDINYIANTLNNQSLGARRAMIEGSLGNSAAASPQLAALNYTSQTALGNALMQAMKENREQEERVGTFNRGTDTFNAEMGLKAAIQNQNVDLAKADFLMKTGQLRSAERDAVQTNKSNALSSFFTSMGNLGQDILNRNQAAAMAESYGVTYNDLMEALKGTTGMIGAFGGKLKKKGGKHA